MSFKKYLTELLDTEKPSEEEKINNPDYIYYCFDPKKNTIHSGWEYREDAVDAQKEAMESGRILKVLSKRFLLSQGIDPNDNKNWSN